MTVNQKDDLTMDIFLKPFMTEDVVGGSTRDKRREYYKVTRPMLSGGEKRLRMRCGRRKRRSRSTTGDDGETREI